MAKPTYSSSPIPGGTSNWRGEVIILCSRRCPKGGVQVSSGAREHHSVHVTFYFDVSASVSCGEERFPARLPFYSGPFPTTHMHVEHSDWLDSVKATSSGRFRYLSATMSRLASFLRNHSKTVSILTYLPRLARRPRLLRHPLPDQRNLGLQLATT